MNERVKVAAYIRPRPSSVAIPERICQGLRQANKEKGRGSLRSASSHVAKQRLSNIEYSKTSQMSVDDDGTEYLAKQARTAAAIDNARANVVAEAFKIQSTIRKVCGAKQVKNMRSKSIGKIRPKSSPRLFNPRTKVDTNTLPTDKVTILEEVAKLPPKFFATSMIEGNREKWKTRRNDIVNLDKLFSEEQRYLKVQQSIDNAFYNLKCQLDIKKHGEERSGEMAPIRLQAETPGQTRKSMSVEKRDYPQLLPESSNLMNAILDACYKIPEVLKVEDKQEDRGKTTLGDTLHSSKMVEKLTQKLRSKIDKVYMKFAGTPSYDALYRMSKEELEKKDQTFLQELRKPKYDYELTDFFLPAEDLEAVPQNILTVPLIKTHLATNKRKYKRTLLEGSEADTEEVLFSDSRRTISKG